MDPIVPFLGRFANIYLAGQIFTVGVFALIISDKLALNRALVGRWSALPFVALPLLCNYVFLVGLMYYMFRRRAGAVGDGDVDLAAGKTVAVEAGGVDGVRGCAVLLPPVGARHLRGHFQFDRCGVVPMWTHRLHRWPGWWPSVRPARSGAVRPAL